MAFEFDPTAFEGWGGNLDGNKDKNDLSDEEDGGEEEEGSGGGGTQSENEMGENLVWILEIQKEVFEEIDMQNDDEQPHKNAKQNKSSYFKEILLTAVEYMKKKIVSNTNDKTAVVFFNTSKSNNELNLPGIHVLLPLSFGDAGRINKLEKEAEKKYVQFTKEYGTIEASHTHQNALLSDVFWVSSQMFSAENSKYKNKKFKNKILFFTTRDDPKITAKDKTAVIQRANDFQNDVADFELFPLELPGKEFDITKFYADVLMIDEEMANVYKSTAKMKLGELREVVRRREFPQRVYGANIFEICEGFEVSVGVYTSILQCRIPTPVLLNALDNKPLKSITKLVHAEDKELIKPDDVIQYVQFSTKKVLVNSKEKKQLTNYAGVGMKLMGFKPQSSVRLHYNISHPFFVYPSDSVVEGSTKFLAALMHHMYQKHLAAVVAWIPRESSQLSFAALIPQLEEVDEYSNQLTPPGFHLIKLPFAEDIRHIPPPPSSPPPSTSAAENDELQKQTTLAENVLKSLLINNFHPVQVENPVLQRHYAILEALALGEEKAREIRDDLQPQYDEFENIKEEVLAWRNSIYGDGGYYEDMEGGGTAAQKRNMKANLNEEFRSNKTAKTSQAESNTQANALDDQTMQSYACGGRTNKLTVAQLKSWLANKKIPCFGNKAALVAKVESYFGINN